MYFKNQKSLLFIDNALSHTESELSNIRLVFLPANTRTITQPLDQGIIKTKVFFIEKSLLNTWLQMPTQEISNFNNFNNKESAKEKTKIRWT